MNKALAKHIQFVQIVNKHATAIPLTLLTYYFALPLLFTSHAK